MTRLPTMFAFTLVETLISVGILSTVAAIGFGSGIDSYEREIARSDYTSTLWTALKARSDAMSGLCGGDSCVAGMPQKILLDPTHTAVFEPISGLVSNPQSVVLRNGSTTDTLSINSEGQISFTP